MCIDNFTLKKINDICTYYGLDYFETKVGVLISNEAKEFFILKLKNGSVRKLLHQNHGRSGKIVPLPCDIEDIDNEIVQKHFHTQSWSNNDIKQTLLYIYNHGKVRKTLDAKRRAILDQMLAVR